jgi:hypothetical protein
VTVEEFHEVSAWMWRLVTGDGSFGSANEEFDIPAEVATYSDRRNRLFVPGQRVLIAFETRGGRRVVTDAVEPRAARDRRGPRQSRSARPSSATHAHRAR